MSDETRMAEDEQAVEALRRLLVQEEPLPLGARSRWQARLRRESRRTALGRAPLVVLGLAAFLGACALVGPAGFTGWTWAAFLAGGAAYSMGVRALVGWQGGRRTGSAGR
jgi:hypothetical protein